MKPCLHPRFIDREASQIVKRLRDNDHQSYLVGGCIRDLLLGIVPKDYDIATEARPNQVKRIIPASYVIGKRFRLVLVRRGAQQFEVATFRRNVRPEDIPEDAETPVGDNFFGTPEEDAKRRDFTINSMFYDPGSRELIDFCDGIQDIKAGVIRIIGDPCERLNEDSIRILRALRLAHKIRFRIESDLRASMKKNAGLLSSAVLPRKREEYLKLLKLRQPSQAFLEAYDLNILDHTLPSLVPIFESDEKRELFIGLLDQMPATFRGDPMFLFGHFMWAYLNTLHGQDLTQFTKKRFDEDTVLDAFMRNELGMFKAEQSIVLRAIRVQYTMADIEKFERRGPRRKTAFVNSDAFELALEFAKSSQLLSANQYLYWVQAAKSPQRPPS